MQRYDKERSNVFLIVIICFSFCVVHSSIAEVGQENRLTPQNPRYELNLSQNEFYVFNSSVEAGVRKYGGDAEFNLKVSKGGGDLAWEVTINNPRLIEILGYWATEKSAELVNSLDIDNLDPDDKLALTMMKSLNAKIAYAQENPVWDKVKLSGLVVEVDGNPFIEGEDGKYQVTGIYLQELGKRVGRRVIVNGYIKVEDQIEVVGFLEKKENTLELFVMSMCPFARAAESTILSFLDSYDGDTKPTLEIRYIFYERNVDGEMVLTSMHGEKEIRENLVQMVIRDKYGEYYHKYLLERIADQNEQWGKLAKKIGMKEKDIEFVEQMIDKKRETLIRREYSYVAGPYLQIYDGSPTYVWESERVRDVREIDAFSELDSPGDSCSDGTE